MVSPHKIRNNILPQKATVKMNKYIAVYLKSGPHGIVTEMTRQWVTSSRLSFIGLPKIIV